MTTLSTVTPVSTASVPAGRPPRTASPRTAPKLRSLVALAALAALVGCGGHNSGDDDPVAPAPPAAPLRSSLIPAGSNTNLIEARTSQAPTQAGAAPSTVYDDFRLATAGTAASVSWQGIYCVQADGAPAPAATASQFIIVLYPDSAGRPNLAAPLSTTTVTPGGANQVLERNVSGLTCGSAANTTWALYNYSATLTAPVSLAAGTTYWISVQAVTPSYDVYWGFRAGATDNSLSLIRFMGVYDTFTFDRAFALNP
ncbi:MAG: hypothetical protein K8R60_10100 [Burkholderiales bacterium]|nr:hypothetical protein [Burkholderiales bacterium]